MNFICSIQNYQWQRLNELKTTINAEVVTMNDFLEVAAKINSLKIPEERDFKKTVTMEDGTTSVVNIIKHHSRKTIVICNRVEKVQQLYNKIIAAGISNQSGFEILTGLKKKKIDYETV